MELVQRIEGAMLGTAIGDAWGVPVEMWSGADIHARFGYVSTLLPSSREIHPEGPWISPGPAGTISDDTRWKVLILDAFLHAGIGLTDRQLAAYLIDVAEGKLSFAPSKGVDDVIWQASLTEWVDTARAYLNTDWSKLHRFYGGELTCAGMLFTPLVGLLYPGQPLKAYEHAFRLDIFDLGYTRDLASLLAAFSAAAMVGKDDWAKLILEIDPMGYMKRRLVKRNAFRMLKIAQEIYQASQTAQAWHDRERLASQQLSHHLAFYPFDPGEVFLLVLSGLMLGEGDFERTICFLVNFGRDNDTTAAIAGLILGALKGRQGIPVELVQTILAAGPQQGVDLLSMAEQLVNLAKA